MIVIDINLPKILGVSSSAKILNDSRNGSSKSGEKKSNKKNKSTKKSSKTSVTKESDNQVGKKLDEYI